MSKFGGNRRASRSKAERPMLTPVTNTWVTPGSATYGFETSHFRRTEDHVKVNVFSFLISFLISKTWPHKQEPKENVSIYV